MYIDRAIAPTLHALADTPLGRCLVLTGARQTGKTTLLQHEFGRDYEYFSFDEPFARAGLARRSAADWLARGRRYIFDEVQKAPDFMGTVKAMLDSGPQDLRLLLSGSAQIHLLSSIRESLAGRSVTRELYPLSVPELAGIDRPLIKDILSSTCAKDVRTLFAGMAFLSHRSASVADARRYLEHVLTWGGMPALLALEDPEHKWIWIEEYCQTYLQRDLSDLARVADLDDFFRLERLAALRTAGILNYADLARDADLSAVTAKKYLRYLMLSYQAFLLPPYRSRARERLIKAPRLHWADIGVQRVLSDLRAGLTGQQFDTAIVAEIHKVCRTLGLKVELMYLRTKDGREVDLLTRLPNGGYIAWEMKAGERAARVDGRHFRGLDAYLDGPLLAGIVVYQGDSIEIWEENMLAVPAHVLFADGRTAR